MKLTLTREQIPAGRRAVAWLRNARPETSLIEACPTHESLPGYQEWLDEECGQPSDDRWADTIEAAITEAEGGKDADPVSDADERAFWREAYTLAFTQCSGNAEIAVSYADVALAGYRKAFGGES